MARKKKHDPGVEDVQQLNPDDLLRGFGKTSLLTFVLLSVVIHVAIIGSGSALDIYRHFVPAPEAVAPVEEPAAEDAQSQPSGDAQAGDSAAAQSDEPIIAPEQPAADKPADQTSDDPQVDPEYLKKLNEAADPEDIPREPTDLIDLDSL